MKEEAEVFQLEGTSEEKAWRQEIEWCWQETEHTVWYF